MPKIKVAIFALTGCEGCEFHLLSLNELLLDFWQDFTITNWRLLAQAAKKDFDIAFIEGAVTTKKHIKLLKEIRETSKIVVALGACAITGNVFAEFTPRQRKEIAPQVYDKNYQLKAKFLNPVEKYIKVDFKVAGCPPDIEKFKSLLAQFKNKKITSKIKSVSALNYVAQIEGHGSLKINFKNQKASFKVEESKRLVEGLLLEKFFTKAPFINSRICGICPIAHNLCSWKAIESALKIKPSEETNILRQIMLCAQIIKSHLLHLFFLVLPDYAGLKSSIQLSLKYPAEFHLMLNIKRVAEKALQIIAGSTAFPINPVLGGFAKIPDILKLNALKNEIYEVLDEAADLIALFSQFKPINLNTDIQFLSITPKNNAYPYYQGSLNQKIKEIVQRDSPAKLGILKNNQVIKVGAMSRMKNYFNKLNPKAKNHFNKLNFSLNNPFNNNFAQAIEILHFLEETILLIDKLNSKNLNNAHGLKLVLPTKQARGEACLEAPRGVLIHQLVLDKQGKILDYNIIPPTQINLASLKKEAQGLVEKLKNSSREKIIRQTEKLIKAFDPCITCAVH